MNNILRAFENGECALGIFIDLSKAYDCLNYNTLYEKLERYGIRGPALKWVQSYLTGRSQRVCISNENGTYLSNLEDVTVGIPQGSIIGPLLFTIYVNDIPSVLINKNQHIVNYADDTNLLINGENLETVLKKVVISPRT